MGIVSRAEDFPLVRETIAMELQIRQKPGTEPLLKDYLSSISAPNDTVYAILYEPTFCPRCEIDIKPYSKMLSELAPQSPFVLITAYPDSARAAAYNKEKGYAADGYIYDTDEAFMRIFSFNTNGLSGLYILKMCKSTGELLVGANSFYTSMEYTKELTGWTERMEQHNFAQASGAAGGEPWQLPRPACEPLTGPFTDHGLKLDGQMLSDVYDVPKFDWPYFFYNDKLNNCVMLFKEDGGSLRFSARIEADSTERDHFIELSDDWKRLLDKSSLCYIPLAATMTDSQRIGVSYSLPHVMEDTIAKNGGLAFFNAPAIVIRDAGTLAKSPMYCPDFMLFKDTTYFYAHFNFCVFKGEVIYSCQKMTWPMMYERWEYEHNPVMNPFSEKFYSSGNPWLAAFSLRTGKLVERFAELEPCAEASRTGYWFVNPVMYSNGDELLYSDGFSGAIHITRDIHKGAAESYSAFAVDTAAFPQPDTAMFYRQEYTKAYDRFYYRCITAASMDAGKVTCIVRYARNDMANPTAEANDHTVVTIDRRTGLATERLIPRYQGMRPMGYGLLTANGRVSPFGFYRRADGSYVVRVWDA